MSASGGMNASGQTNASGQIGEPHGMKRLTAWGVKQARAERNAVTLEDALLTGSFTRYFVHRLRFLLARTVVATLIHALKIILLLGAFPRSEFLIIVVAQAVAALIGDFWWGALEELRSQIRLLQRRGRRYLVPKEIGRWLSLVAPAALIVPILAGIYAAVELATGQLSPVEAYVAVLAAAVALDLVTRTYHSGAYALRRVYRPLPTLIAVDVVSVAVLIVLWPVLGLWAYPAAELVSLIVVISISLRYTSRTYRSLAMPTLMPLIRERRRVPSLATLRASLAPGIAYALVGLEALVVVAGLAVITTEAGTALIVLLAAISPLSRASFEWARLLYFDLKRLELPLLAGLRQKFDRAMVWLAVVIGLIAGIVACVIALVMLDQPTALLLVALVALFLVRSVLAAAQMQAFTRTVYARLAIAGIVGVIGLVLVFALVTPADERLLGAAAALAVSLALLALLPPPTDPGDMVLAPSDWLRTFRAQARPARVAQLRFDASQTVRAVTPEMRRTEEWRREEVANRIAERIRRRGGFAAWVGAHELWLASPADRAPLDTRVLVHHGAGLVRTTRMTIYEEPSGAAPVLAEVALRTWRDDGAPAKSTEIQRAKQPLTNVAGVLAEFARASRVPSATTRAPICRRGSRRLGPSGASRSSDPHCVLRATCVPVATRTNGTSRRWSTMAFCAPYSWCAETRISRSGAHGAGAFERGTCAERVARPCPRRPRRSARRRKRLASVPRARLCCDLTSGPVHVAGGRLDGSHGSSVNASDFGRDRGPARSKRYSAPSKLHGTPRFLYICDTSSSPPATRHTPREAGAQRIGGGTCTDGFGVPATGVAGGGSVAAGVGVVAEPGAWGLGAGVATGVDDGDAGVPGPQPAAPLTSSAATITDPTAVVARTRPS